MRRAYQKWEQPSRRDEKAAKASAEASNWREVCRKVDQRDGYRCRVCDKTCSAYAISLLDKAHHHHIVYRSLGGEDKTANVCLVCSDCHFQEHVKRTLSIEGNADTGLTFSRRDQDGQWYVERQEMGVRITERD